MSSTNMSYYAILRYYLLAVKSASRFPRFRHERTPVRQDIARVHGTRPGEVYEHSDPGDRNDRVYSCPDRCGGFESGARAAAPAYPAFTEFIQSKKMNQRNA